MTDKLSFFAALTILIVICAIGGLTMNFGLRVNTLEIAAQKQTRFNMQTMSNVYKLNDRLLIAEDFVGYIGKSFLQHVEKSREIYACVEDRLDILEMKGSVDYD